MDVKADNSPPTDGLGQANGPADWTSAKRDEGEESQGVELAAGAHPEARAKTTAAASAPKPTMPRARCSRTDLLANMFSDLR